MEKEEASNFEITIICIVLFGIIFSSGFATAKIFFPTKISENEATKECADKGGNLDITSEIDMAKSSYTNISYKLNYRCYIPNKTLFEY